MAPKIRLMERRFVMPYVKTNTKASAEAEVMCEAVGRLKMSFVPIMNVDQHAVLVLLRVLKCFLKANTA